MLLYKYGECMFCHVLLFCLLFGVLMLSWYLLMYGPSNKSLQTCKLNRLSWQVSLLLNDSILDKLMDAAMINHGSRERKAGTKSLSTTKTRPQIKFPTCGILMCTEWMIAATKAFRSYPPAGYEQPRIGSEATAWAPNWDRAVSRGH